MIIQTDKEGKGMIEQLCDIALKSGGLQSLNGITQILSSIKPLPEPEKKDEKKK